MPILHNREANEWFDLLSIVHITGFLSLLMKSSKVPDAWVLLHQINCLNNIGLTYMADQKYRKLVLTLKTLNMFSLFGHF